MRIDDHGARAVRRTRVPQPVNVRAKPFMARHMNLNDAFQRRFGEPVVELETEVDGIHVQVVDVEQEPAIRRFANAGEKLAFAHL